MALKHKTAEMATINDTKKVCCDSENTCTILIHQQGIASVSICETMGFEIQTIYSPRPPPKKKKNCLCIVFSFSWDGCNTRINMKNTGYAKFWGQISCTIGDVQLAY